MTKVWIDEYGHIVPQAQGVHLVTLSGSYHYAMGLWVHEIYSIEPPLALKELRTKELLIKEEATLFELPIEQTPPSAKLTCNTCEHRQRWECNSVVVQYCGVRKSNRTNNGLLKIKCKTDACLLYKSCIKP